MELLLCSILALVVHVLAFAAAREEAVYVVMLRPGAVVLYLIVVMNCVLSVFREFSLKDDNSIFRVGVLVIALGLALNGFLHYEGVASRGEGEESNDLAEIRSGLFGRPPEGLPVVTSIEGKPGDGEAGASVSLEYGGRTETLLSGGRLWWSPIMRVGFEFLDTAPHFIVREGGRSEVVNSFIKLRLHTADVDDYFMYPNLPFRCYVSLEGICI